MKATSVVITGLFFASTPVVAGIADYASVPPTIIEVVDPNVMIDMSIEGPMGGAAYNDQPGTLSSGATCAGRVSVGGNSNIGVCYFKTQEYLGYFDPNKCYDYSTDHFVPNGATNADHECSGQFSGNMLNWALTTAIDEFRWAMTGGNRVVDTASETVIKRARKQNNNDWFPVKVLSSSLNVAPSTVTPFATDPLYIYNSPFGVYFGGTYSTTDADATYNANVQVCNSTQGVEDNCTRYGSNYKPEGLIQKNADRMRFALMSYTTDDRTRQGGVLRANMKYLGPTRPATGGGTEDNPKKEFLATDGTFVFNPDGVTIGSGVDNSGVINYINQFAKNAYKSGDPASELYYECVRYFKNLGPTSSTYSGLSDDKKDGFPVLTTWTDPQQHACQKNYIIGINDANPWNDKKLPGTYFQDSVFSGHTIQYSDYGDPPDADATINVTTWTNRVGQLQGINGTSQRIGCVSGDCPPASGNLNSSTAKVIPGLGEVMGTFPAVYKENSYYISGLAYYANSQDLRSDFEGRQSVSTFMIDTQEYNATPLLGQMNMLWLTGKYGGFKDTDQLDTNSDGVKLEPNLAVEWDANNDGVPDNYVLATEPSKLVSGLTKALTDVKARVNGGSAAAVVANSRTGVGATYQALYEPTAVRGVEQIKWAGTLHALFIDDKSLLREDSNHNATLDNYATDKVVKIEFDPTAKTTKVYRYSTTDGNIASVTPTVVGLESLNHIWDARDQLAAISSSDIVDQRTFDSESGGRFIFTWLDKDNDGVVDDTETFDFTSSTFPDSTATDANFRYLGVTSTEAGNLVDFIRGKEGITGYRSRTIDYDGDGTDDAWRLGDVLHSSPRVVGAPSEDFDTLYNDSSYADFKTKYANRRQVVYVGANDGMLHAFNGGFWNGDLKKFETSPNEETAYALGAEIWAYVPFNLLPHLQWLKDPNYPHVYYVDGPPQSFDVNIFTSDDDHPHGWGTILVVGMRLGGSEISVDANGDGTAEKTMRSAYMIFDITNPEVPPKLIAELSHSQLGLTTGQPTIAKKRTPGTGNDWDNPVDNTWYLYFGSGPTVLSSVTSNQNARLFAYNLNTKTMVTGFPKSMDGNSFVGDLKAADVNFDYIDDAVYFGTVGGTIAAQTGKLKRLPLTATDPSDLLVANQPIVEAPVVSVDETGRVWVNFGTGRLFASGDNKTSAQQSFYGVMEPLDNTTGALTWGTVSASNLQDVTSIRVFTNGSVTPTDLQIPSGTDIDTFAQLKTAIKTSRAGWFMNLATNGTNPSTRNITAAAKLKSTITFNDYVPASDACEPEGKSESHAINFQTGTAELFAPYGSSSVYTNGGYNMILSSVSLGQGLASSPAFHRGSANSSSVTIITQMSTGAIVQKPMAVEASASGRQSWRQILNYTQ